LFQRLIIHDEFKADLFFQQGIAKGRRREARILRGEAEVIANRLLKTVTLRTTTTLRFVSIKRKTTNVTSSTLMSTTGQLLRRARGARTITSRDLKVARNRTLRFFSMTR